MKQLVLFGAGVYAKMYKSLLDYLNIPFTCFADNDSTKVGTRLYGKQIISPQELLSKDCSIIISCTHGEQITRQLEEMGIADRLIGWDTIYEWMKRSKENSPQIVAEVRGNELSVIVDMYEGIGWGGTEMWAATVTKGLRDRDYRAVLWGSWEQVKLDEQYECMVERFPTEGTIEQMVEKMRERLPIVLINNFAGCAYLAAVLLKMEYPDRVHIIDVIHNDSKSLFQSHVMFREWVDSFVCVSEKIRNTIITDYGILAEKVHFKEQPIKTDDKFIRRYDKSARSIRIGYAARVVRQQKRADLFPELIQRLENMTANYRIEIAGDGECLPMIREFVRQRHLEDRVILRGRIGKKAIPDFWKNQDIYLNFSEYEGTSLAMLEAMSYACVPVVTDVSGVSEFVEDGRNGHVCEVGDLDAICRAICHLEAHRELLESYGEICRAEISRRCRTEDYIEYIRKLVDLV